MDKLISLFSSKLDDMLNQYIDKLNTVPVFRLEQNLPDEFMEKNQNEKKEYFIQKYKTTNPIYLLIQGDLNQLKKGKVSIDELHSINLDVRFLESLGFNEKKISAYYEFCNRVLVVYQTC